MTEIHFINTGRGDCTIIKGANSELTVVDICKGNYEIDDCIRAFNQSNDYCILPTNPIKALKRMQVNDIKRFILTHPDMDHLDGFYSLAREYKIEEFWDNGLRREKPEFLEGNYYEKDWDYYQKVLRGGTSTAVKNLLDDNGGIKFLIRDEMYVLSPNSKLVNEANKTEDFNDGSYIIIYLSANNKILLPGDAHDKSFEHIINRYRNLISNCNVMLAPHHGRDSDRDWSFLDIIKPKLTILGCAEEGAINYGEYRKRGLETLSKRKVGNISIYDRGPYLEVYVQNTSYAERYQSPSYIKPRDIFGNSFFTTIVKNG